MKILVIDANALALDFCLRATAEGHEVKWFIRDRGRNERDVGQGLVPHVSDWKPHMRWADLIFLPDNAAYVHDLEWYRKNRYPIFGASKESAQWELNRSAGVNVFQQAGIKVLDGVPFNSFTKAAGYVRKTNERFVCKPDGDVDKALTYVAKSAADMVYMLEKWAKERPATKFLLQKFVGGVEMAVGAWYGPFGRISPWNENFEFKKLMPGDVGPSTGEQATVMRYTNESKLADKVLAPLEDAIIASGHVGYVDVNCIIDNRGTPWPLEFTMRPGWPHFNIVQRLHHNTADWMLAALHGEDTRGAFVTDHVATGVVVSIPDYPYGKLPRAEVSGVPIYYLDKHAEDVHLCEAKLGKAPMPKNGTIQTQPAIVTAGSYILVTSGVARSVKESAQKALQTAKELLIPSNAMYRVDAGMRLKTQLPKLEAMGYATGMTF